MKNDKVDHPRKGSKDLADAVCGAIFNAIAYTPKEENEVVEVKTLESVRQEVRRNTIDEYEQMKSDGVIRAPKRKMPKELEEYLARISTI
jgi:hypothetical protein